MRLRACQNCGQQATACRVREEERRKLLDRKVLNQPLANELCKFEQAKIARKAIDLRRRTSDVITASKLNPNIFLAEPQSQLDLNERYSSADAANGSYYSLSRSCSEIVNLWPTQAVKLRPYSSGSMLPVDTWMEILKMLCRDIEMDGVRSASVVARDICNASQASKELWTASQVALQHLSSLCSTQSMQIPSALGYLGCTIKNDFIYRPILTGITNAEEVLAIAKACSPGTHYRLNLLDRSTLILGTFNFLHLSGPSNVPFDLLYAVAQERNKHTLTKEDCNKYSKSPSASMSDFKLRRLLICLGIQTGEALTQAASTHRHRLLLYNHLNTLSNQEFALSRCLYNASLAEWCLDIYIWTLYKLCCTF